MKPEPIFLPSLSFNTFNSVILPNLLKIYSISSSYRLYETPLKNNQLLGKTLSIS